MDSLLFSQNIRIHRQQQSYDETISYQCSTYIKQLCDKVAAQSTPQTKLCTACAHIPSLLSVASIFFITIKSDASIIHTT